MARKIECDRCKKIYSNVAWQGQEMALNSGYEKELCGVCIRELKRWIEEYVEDVAEDDD